MCPPFAVRSRYPFYQFNPIKSRCFNRLIGFSFFSLLDRIPFALLDADSRSNHFHKSIFRDASNVFNALLTTCYNSFLDLKTAVEKEISSIFTAF